MKTPSRMAIGGVLIALLAAAFVGLYSLALGQADDSKIPLEFSGGYETDPRDGGRPVVLIAAALKVSPEVFREAFSGVRPAKDGPPSKDLAQRNKSVLMKALAPHGVTNEHLDQVSDYYRYKRERGELWTHVPALAFAQIEDGKVKTIVLTNRGAGYSAPPIVSIPGMDTVRLKASIEFTNDLRSNGAIRTIEIDPRP